MRLRSSTSGKPLKAGRRNATVPKRPNAQKAARPDKSPAVGEETEVTQLRRELNEAREQQAATSEVLKVISSSPGELDPVFQAMLENATRICGATFGTLVMREGKAFRRVAMHNGPIALVDEWQRRALVPFDEAPTLQQLVDTKQVIHIVDMAAEHPDDTIYKLAGARTILIVPMLKENELIGGLSIYRQEVGPFTGKQIELVTNFAAQAVIAIENTRLFEAEQRRSAELSESLEQQTATSEVLKVISSSPGELGPVFEAMLVNAVRICDAKFGNLFLGDENGLRIGASHGAPEAYNEFLRGEGLFIPNTELGVGQMVLTKQCYQVPDLTAAPTLGDRLREETIRLAGARTIIGVPMLKDDKVVGAIVIYRQEVRPFTDKQVELLTNFAAQAAIAIENTRLLSELRESLAQQTATSEVLEVISSSPGELQPVFDTMLAKATQVCEATYGTMWLCEGADFRSAAIHGDLPPAYVELRRSGTLVHPGPEAPMRRVVETREPAQIADMREGRSYLNRDPISVASVEIAGIRTLVAVPMLKDGVPIGVISIYRKEVRPFTDKQIALLTNFAAQAVIAIENTRLLSELRQSTDDLTDSLEQQTATSEVLQVISSSPGELKPVFDTMLAKATELCGATFGSMVIYEGSQFRRVAAHNAPAALAEEWKRTDIVDLTKSATLHAMVTDRCVLHLLDLAEQFPDDPLHRLAGARTLLSMPMLKEGELIGAIAIFRQEVRPFTDKQIELVTNFAAQAVIAIENTRLLERAA